MSLRKARTLVKSSLSPMSFLVVQVNDSDLFTGKITPGPGRGADTDAEDDDQEGAHLG